LQKSRIHIAKWNQSLRRHTRSQGDGVLLGNAQRQFFKVYDG